MFLKRFASIAEPTASPNWQKYFAFREQRKMRRRIFTVVGAPTGFFASAQYVSELVFKPSQLILGLDPMIVMSAGVLATSFASALAFPAIGEATWKRLNKDNADFLNQMDKDFFAVIKKYRSNPNPDNSISLSTKQSPLTTDFYGEKITNVDQYNQWKAIHQKLKALETEEDNDEK